VQLGLAADDSSQSSAAVMEE